jgi:hypothetical protein
MHRQLLIAAAAAAARPLLCFKAQLPLIWTLDMVVAVI